MAIKPSIQTYTYNADASPAASLKQLVNMPYGGKIVDVRAKRTGGSGAVVNVTVTKAGVDADLLSADKSLTATTWTSCNSTLVAANQKLAAGDNIQAEIVSVAGSPTAVHVMVTVQWDTDAR